MEFEKLIFKCTVILKYKTFVSSVYIIPVLEENGWIKNNNIETTASSQSDLQ